MSKKFLALGVVLIWWPFFGTNKIIAQEVTRISVSIPFQFLLDGKDAPAGNYVIERTDVSKPNSLTFRNSKEHFIRLVLVQRVEKENPSATSCLIFLRSEGKLHLSQLWNLGAMNGSQIPSLPVETNGQQREEVKVVMVKPKVH